MLWMGSGVISILHLDCLDPEVQDLCVFLSSKGHMPTMLAPIGRMREKWKTCKLQLRPWALFSLSISWRLWDGFAGVEGDSLAPGNQDWNETMFFSSSSVSCYSRQRCGIKTLLLLRGRRLIAQASGILSSRVQYTLLYREEKSTFSSCLMHRMHLVKQL